MNPDFILELARRGHLLKADAARMLKENRELMEKFNAAIKDGIPLPSLITPDDLLGIQGGIKIDSSGFEVLMDPTNFPVMDGEITGFLSLFHDRFQTLSKVLKRAHPPLYNMPNIRELLKRRGRGVGFTAMIREVRTSKKGNTILTLEDETGEVMGIVMKRRPVNIKPPPIEDEVLGVVGDVADERDTVFVRELYRPDVSSSERKVTLAGEEAYLLITSDTHLGSKTFLKEKWKRFIMWLNGEIRVKGLKDSIVDKIRFLLIAGDLVDGVGIYKDQDKDLEIINVMDQYEALAEVLSQIPKHIKVILIPGNHDAVRILEPQPALPKEIRSLFPSRFIFLGSPSYMKMMGVKVLAYHGRSIDDLITKIPSASYEDPMTAQIAMLKMRHLSPYYGGRSPIVPLHKDLMAIREVPDVFISGHIHRFEIKPYRGVIVVQASAWQGQTEYQKMRNVKPQPARAALIGLHNLSAREVDFSNMIPRSSLRISPILANRV